MSKKPSIQEILPTSSGPLVIGQSTEFNYFGSANQPEIPSISALDVLASLVTALADQS
ncbi:hypothetical protein [Eupransor demetentiae]|uniref:Uncharacterized protein n=1 Tax=Eupransor demetentiae TaxID=3109584 RepID=A0ABM9N688_9LACO|nr:hypothetical protein R54876_GBNLAHCA_01303 [Lactobacillaceae bacterium LMG 33000]